MCGGGRSDGWVGRSDGWGAEVMVCGGGGRSDGCSTCYYIYLSTRVYIKRYSNLGRSDTSISTLVF